MKNIKRVIVLIICILILAAIGSYIVLHGSTAKTTTTPAASMNTPAAASNGILNTKSDVTLGQYLTNSQGNALYTYGGDTSGQSNCTSSCIASWPAYVDKGTTAGLPADVNTLKRTDNGRMQYTYKGMPLYTFVGDSQGQITGNGISNFHIAKP